MLEIKHEHDGKNGEFYMGDNHPHLAEMVYTWASESVFIIEHTNVDDSLRGQGIGNQLLDGTVAWTPEKRSKLFHSALLQSQFLLKIPLFMMC